MSAHTPHCRARMKWGDGQCECGGRRRPRRKAATTPAPKLPTCPHPARNGRHEVYMGDGAGGPGFHCRACGLSMTQADYLAPDALDP